MIRKKISVLADQLLGTLGEQGYRSTGPRRAVASAIAAKNRQFTAEELRDVLPNVGRATVFRSLKILVDAGMLCRVLLEDGHLHYQLSHRGHHHHLLCGECGTSQDVMGCDIEGQLHQGAAAHKFQLSGHWLEVYGRCETCLSGQRTEKSFDISSG